MKSKNQVFTSILTRNHYQVEWESGRASITNAKGKVSPVRIYLALSVIMTLVGVVLILLASFIVGVIILASSIPLYNKVSKLRSRESMRKGRHVQIHNKGLYLKDQFDSFQFANEDIERLEYQVERDKDLSAGKLSIILKSQAKYVLLEIFGDDKRYVEDDIKTIKKHAERILWNGEE